MSKLQLLLCLALAWQHGQTIAATGAMRSGESIAGAAAHASAATGLSKSRQSRCVRCYEDRYYGSSGSGSGSGGYGSRSGDDGRAAWYYASYDRYDDRGSRDRDYDRLYNRDDRYALRSYDRYEGRGYDDYRRGSGAGGVYDRGYGYDNRDRYYADRYTDGYRDRYYDRSRTGGYDRYDRDPYDRYYTRYDYRNYRPWDETYRGQSGFDNSGRGYYFAGDDDNRHSAPNYDRERAQSPAYASPCGHLVNNCPYGNVGGTSERDSDRDRDRGTKVSSAAIGSDSSRGGGHTSVIGQSADGKPNGQSSWTYLNDQDKQNSRGSGAGVGRDKERDPQSSSYGGRPRPLGGSYLFDRDSNAVPENQNEATNGIGSSVGVGIGEGERERGRERGVGVGMPAAAAQTAPAVGSVDGAPKAENA